MEKYNLKGKGIKLHNIVFAITSARDYDMDRLLLLEDMPDCNYREYVLCEGGHCSCYGFDDTEWDCIKLSEEELKTIADKNDWNHLRSELKKFLKDY